MKLRVISAWAAGVVAAVLSVLYYIFNPATSRLAPKCMFHAVTGLDCPGCGSQRMLHSLMHGDFGAAWEANPFIICAMPVIALMIVAAAQRKRFPEIYARINSPAAIAVYTVVLIGWTVWRNF